jgi:membrane protease YdiL (CAAX protease family)
MSTPTVTVPAPRELSRLEEAVDRYEGIKQYSLWQILAVWAAAALPMGVLAWIVAPALKDNFSGAGNVPMAKALLLVLTAGLIWQGVLVAGLVWLERQSLRWSTLREALWLRSPRSPTSGRIGGRLWLIVIPLILAYAAVPFLVPSPASPADRDFGTFLDSDAGQTFLSGNWRWFGLLLVLWLFNTVLGEELLFRGLLLPRMNRTFGRGDWVANGVLFAAYHVHVPWVMLETLLGDTLLLAYPTKRYQSAWLGIVVHSAQSVVLAAIVLTFVL